MKQNMQTLTGILLIVLALALIWSSNDKNPPNAISGAASPSGTAAIGGNFALTDQNGHAVHASDYRGKLMLIYFGYTHCPTVCPTSVSNMSKAMDLLGAKADQVAPLFITVDPERDTPAVLKDYLSNFNKHMIGLTGTPAQIKTVATDYKAYFAKQGAPWDEQSSGHMEMHEESGNYAVNHSSFIYLMDKNGKYLQLFQYDASPQTIAAAINAELK